MNTKFAVQGVDARTPLGIAAPVLLVAKAEPLFELEAAARGGADADAVHDMRVASRRLREAMRLLSPLYQRREMRARYRQVRRITRALGPVRDADVFISEFGALSSQVGKGGKRAVAFLVGYRAGQRQHELEVLDSELARLNLRQSRRTFSKVVCSISGSTEAARPLSDFAHAAIAERAAVVFGAQPASLYESAMQQQHALRIAYKRLRYAVETFAPCYGDDFDALHTVLTEFQDTLGELHDAHVFLEMLRSPELASAAEPAGVSAADFAEIVTLLDVHAHEAYVRFEKLASRHPAESVLPALLLPLTRLPEPEEGTVASEPLVIEDETPISAPVIVGDEPWAEGWHDSMPQVLSVDEDNA
ncbi:MAG: CHAD domain-containing protein [Coriobacteriia bacterium]